MEKNLRPINDSKVWMCFIISGITMGLYGGAITFVENSVSEIDNHKAAAIFGVAVYLMFHGLSIPKPKFKESVVFWITYSAIYAAVFYIIKLVLI